MRQNLRSNARFQLQLSNARNAGLRKTLFSNITLHCQFFANMPLDNKFMRLMNCELKMEIFCATFLIKYQTYLFVCMHQRFYFCNPNCNFLVINVLNIDAGVSVLSTAIKAHQLLSCSPGICVLWIMNVTSVIISTCTHTHAHTRSRIDDCEHIALFGVSLCASYCLWINTMQS